MPGDLSIDQRIKESKTWGEWAPGLVYLIKQALEEWAQGPRHVIRCHKVLAKPSEELFRKHCLAGHRPWRSDCAACIDAMAHIRPHRRMKFSRVCGMNIDISGPHRTLGAEGQDVAKPRYFIVCAYTFPVFKMSASGSEEGPALRGAGYEVGNPVAGELAGEESSARPEGMEREGDGPQPWEEPETQD